LLEPTADGSQIYTASCELLKKTQTGRRPVRLLGICVSHLTLAIQELQLSLFQESKPSSKRKNLNDALDSLSEKFGEYSVRPATLLTK
jgi:hypothetical protein